MILRCDNLAWVRSDDGRTSPFDAARLAASLLRAAARAGHGDWWLAESVALAMQEFIIAHCPQQTLPAALLSELLEDVLTALGYPDIARAYAQRRRCAELRLDQMTGPLSELEFFQRLDAALQVALDSQLASVRLRGLRSCVMRLRGAHYWSASCRRLAEEILCHVRERVARARPRHAGELQLMVTAS